MTSEIKKFSIDDNPIDIVYLWCDSSDENWRQKKNEELEKYGKSLDNDSVGECRFVDNDELRYSLRSLEKFAPWINNIFIVTDKQVPEWLDVNNPKIRIIDHPQIPPTYMTPGIPRFMLPDFWVMISPVEPYSRGMPWAMARGRKETIDSSMIRFPPFSKIWWG